ncbi:MAG: DUF655 domain-containing protein [Candidatus Woesearchaeota archaeon]|jgi:putative nucleotide binding protein|nr:DUF655 domain-containing protein [Candidatus Woesearchaeota archaeon]
MDNRYRREEKKPPIKEENAIILDVIVNSSSFKDNNLAQAIGVNTYNLFELVPKQGVELRAGQKVYVGDGKRDEIQYIKRVLYFDKLSGTASSELFFTIQDIVDEKEEEFVNFFNMAGPISIRRHSLELIPGIGKKHLKVLIDERYIKPFESFKDLTERCPFLAEPSKSISQRILEEIKDETDHKFFMKK